MRIDRLELQNFKKFAQQSFDLHPHFTLLVGENGSGKTSILDALAVAMGAWLVRPPDSEVRNSGRKILRSEIRLEPKLEGDRIQFREMRPTSVTAVGQLAGQEGVSWTRENRGGDWTNNSKAKTALEIIARVYDQDRQGQKVVCPVLAYYGAGRAWLASNERVRAAKANGPARRWAAFYDCFRERIRFAELQKWFLGEAVAAGNRSGRMRPGFEVVKRAVLRCVPEADNIWYDYDRQQVVLSINGSAQPFDNLSAGQRMMMALIADLAIKAVTQNAFLLPPDELGPDDAPLPRLLRETPGVVLIDELDAHLHPKWQRRVATDLKEAFPNIQFICTSHSPQVIGEVSQEEVRVLHEQSTELPPVAYGADSNWILEHVMGARQRSGPATDLIHSIEDGLEEGDLESAKRELLKLRAKVGGEEGEVARLEGSIRNMEALAHEKD